MASTTPAERRAGVYYAPLDYAGFGRRFVCGLIDAAVLWAAWVAIALMWQTRWPLGGFTMERLVAPWMLACFGYLALLKPSRVRTLGYRVAGIKLVDLQGERPSLHRAALRCGLMMLGTGFILIDLLWTLSNTDRQKLSDKLAGTYVVRSRAEPTGRGVVVLAVYCVLTHFFVYGEVRRTARDSRDPQGGSFDTSNPILSRGG